MSFLPFTPYALPQATPTRLQYFCVSDPLDDVPQPVHHHSPTHVYSPDDQANHVGFLHGLAALSSDFAGDVPLVVRTAATRIVVVRRAPYLVACSIEVATTVEGTAAVADDSGLVPQQMLTRVLEEAIDLFSLGTGGFSLPRLHLAEALDAFFPKYWTNHFGRFTREGAAGCTQWIRHTRVLATSLLDATQDRLDELVGPDAAHHAVVYTAATPELVDTASHTSLSAHALLQLWLWLAFANTHAGLTATALMETVPLAAPPELFRPPEPQRTPSGDAHSVFSMASQWPSVGRLVGGWWGETVPEEAAATPAPTFLLGLVDGHITNKRVWLDGTEYVAVLVAVGEYLLLLLYPPGGAVRDPAFYDSVQERVAELLSDELTLLVASLEPELPTSRWSLGWPMAAKETRSVPFHHIIFDATHETVRASFPPPSRATASLHAAVVAALVLFAPGTESQLTTNMGWLVYVVRYVYSTGERVIVTARRADGGVPLLLESSASLTARVMGHDAAVWLDEQRWVPY